VYGKACPATAANFLALFRSGALTGTVVSRISPGEFVQLGRQGSRRLGEVELFEGLKARPRTGARAPALGRARSARPRRVWLAVAP
jgi:cyclophilin family peptidyl-prolyl cis-trans isomerase